MAHGSSGAQIRHPRRNSKARREMLIVFVKVDDTLASETLTARLIRGAGSQGQPPTKSYKFKWVDGSTFWLFIYRNITTVATYRIGVYKDENPLGNELDGVDQVDIEGLSTSPPTAFPYSIACPMPGETVSSDFPAFGTREPNQPVSGLMDHQTDDANDMPGIFYNLATDEWCIMFHNLNEATGYTFKLNYPGGSLPSSNITVSNV